MNIQLDDAILNAIIERTIKREVKKYVDEYFRKQCDLNMLTRSTVKTEAKNAINANFDDVISKVDKKEMASDLALYIYGQIFKPE